MARQQPYPTLETLRKLEACLRDDARVHHHQCMLGLQKVRGASFLGLCRQVLSCTPRVRRLAIAVGAPCALIFLAMIALWWRLSSGPLELDIATPWLRAAIKENFGEGHELKLAGPSLNAMRMGGRRCAFATSSCAMGMALSSPARQKLSWHLGREPPYRPDSGQNA